MILVFDIGCLRELTLFGIMRPTKGPMQQLEHHDSMVLSSVRDPSVRAIIISKGRKP